MEGHTNPVQMAYNSIIVWLQNGRFYPLSSYTLAFFTIVNNLFEYKLILLAVELFNIALFGYFIKKLTGSTAMGFLSMSFIPLLIQFRYRQDPVLSYNLLLQLLFFYILASLILLLFFLDSKKRIYIYLSVLVYLLSLLTYEITYPFFILYILVIYFYGQKKKIFDVLRISSPFIFVAVFCALLTVLLRITLNMPLVNSAKTSIYIPNLSLGPYITALAMQTSAAFPLSYFYSDPSGVFKTGLEVDSTIILIAALIFIGFFIVVLEVLKKAQNEISVPKPDHKMLKSVFAIGLLMLILPGTMMSLSTAYQSFVSWGAGYLPVYISYFGLSMMLSSVVFYLLELFSKKSRNGVIILSLVIAITCSGIGVMNYFNNSTVVDYSNLYWNYPRAIIEDGISNGLMKNVPDGSTLIVDDNYPWDIKPFYLMHSGKDIKFVGTRGLNYVYVSYLQGYKADSYPQSALVSKDGDKYSYRFNSTDNIFYLSYNSNSYKDGYAILSDVKDVTLSNDTIYNLTSTYAYVYVSAPYLSETQFGGTYVSVSGRWANGDTGLYEPYDLSVENMTSMASDKSWKLLLINGDNKTFDMRSMQINKVLYNK